MDPREFLDTAYFLHAEESTEADLRSAVSRAYYASFLVARVLLEKLMQRNAIPREEDRSEHAAVRVMLQASQVREAKVASVKLANLHEARKNSDYVLLTPIGSEDADLALHQAEEIIRLLEQCESTPRIYEAMRFTLNS